MSYKKGNDFVTNADNYIPTYSLNHTPGTVMAARLLEFTRYRCGDDGQPAMLSFRRLFDARRRSNDESPTPTIAANSSPKTQVLCSHGEHQKRLSRMGPSNRLMGRRRPAALGRTVRRRDPEGEIPCKICGHPKEIHMQVCGDRDCDCLCFLPAVESIDALRPVETGGELWQETAITAALSLVLREQDGEVRMRLADGRECLIQVEFFENPHLIKGRKLSS